MKEGTPGCRIPSDSWTTPKLMTSKGVYLCTRYHPNIHLCAGSRDLEQASLPTSLCDLECQGPLWSLFTLRNERTRQAETMKRSRKSVLALLPPTVLQPPLPHLINTLPSIQLRELLSTPKLHLLPPPACCLFP